MRVEPPEVIVLTRACVETALPDSDADPPAPPAAPVPE